MTSPNENKSFWEWLIQTFLKAKARLAIVLRKCHADIQSHYVNLMTISLETSMYKLQYEMYQCWIIGINLRCVYTFINEYSLTISRVGSLLHCLKTWILYLIPCIATPGYQSRKSNVGARSREKLRPESRQTDRIMFRAIYQIHTKLLHLTLSNSPFEFHKKISHIQRYEFHTLLKIYELSDLRAHFMFLKCSHSNNVLNIPPKLAIFMFSNQGKHFRNRRQQKRLTEMNKTNIAIRTWICNYIHINWRDVIAQSCPNGDLVKPLLK